MVCGCMCYTYSLSAPNPKPSNGFCKYGNGSGLKIGESKILDSCEVVYCRSDYSLTFDG